MPSSVILTPVAWQTALAMAEATLTIPPSPIAKDVAHLIQKVLMKKRKQSKNKSWHGKFD
jgi:hypothetical protein